MAKPPPPSDAQGGGAWPRARSLFALVVMVYAATMAGGIKGVDDLVAEHQVAVSMVSHAWFDVSPSGFARIGPDGRSYSSHGVGESILMLPAAMVGHFANSVGMDLFLVMLINPFAAAAAVVTLFLLLKRLGFSPGVSLATSLLFAFATLEWTYAHDAYDVTPTGLFVLLAVLAVSRGPGGVSTRQAFWSGAALGAAVLMRTSTAVLAVPLALYLALTIGRGWSARLRGLCAMAVPLAGALAVIGLYDFLRFHDVLQTGLATPGNGEFGSRYLSAPIPQGVAGLLFSTGKGLLWFSPVIAIGVLGVARLYRRDRALTLLAGGMIAANLLFYARVSFWAGDTSWGPRYMIPVLGLFMIPAAEVLQGWRPLDRARRGVIAAVVAVSVAIQSLGLAISYESGLAMVRLTQRVPDYNDPGYVAYYWTPAVSQLRMHAIALFDVVSGSRYLGRIIPADFWWSPLLGAAPALSVVVLLAMLSVIALLASRLNREARRPSPAPPNPR